MMSTSFLSLLKEEPGREVTDMDASNGIVAIPRPIGLTAPAVNDSQIQGLSISPLTPNAMQPPALKRADVDPNFEPVARGRCNTWPLLPEGFMGSEDHPGIDPATSGDGQRSQGGGLGESPNTGPPKKNTSRRNPWGNMSYADLIAQAIVSSPEGRATLSQIYDWMVQNVPYFKDKGDSNSSAGWKNSIRHNLSLHNRFMRMQNEGTGKSSWWVLNPDAKPGKSTRRRANTLEGSRLEKKRGRVRKKVDGIRNSIEAPASPNLSESIEYYPGSPSGGPLHHPFHLSPQDYRPRASSNASSCGRLSPILAIDADMHDSQVPPMSPGIVGWGPDYWSANNHAHTSHQNHIGHLMHEPYSDRLVESIGEGLKLSTREPWAPHHGVGPHGGSADCLKIPHPHHHMNGFIAQSHSQPPPGYGSFDDYSGYGPPNSQCGGYSHSHPPPKEKHSIRRTPHLTPFHIPPLLPLSSNHNSHNASPTNPIADSHFSPPSCDQEMKPSPSFSSPPPHNTNPPTSHHTPPSTLHRTPSSDQQKKEVEPPKSSSASPSTPSSSLQTLNSHRLMSRSDSESTTMLRVALSHREASCTINGMPHYRQNGMGQLHPGHPGIGGNDLVDLDNIQGGLECNVEEVIKHELQYEDHLNFDFQHGQASSYPHPHSYSHRDPAGGPTGPVQVYSCSSIPRGNHWVR